MSTGKVLLATGASSEMGCAIISALHEDFDMIIAHHIGDDKGFEALPEAARAKLRPMYADFRDETDTERFLNEAAEICPVPTHMLFLPAGRFEYKKLAKREWSEAESSINISVRSSFLTAKKFAPAMAKAHYGRIVFMLSSVTTGVPPKYLSDYVTAKYAALGLMKALSAELADRHITVNGISPTMIATKFVSAVPELIVQQSAESNPMGRNARLDDVIPAVRYLFSDEAGFITGQNILISGGA